MTRFISQLQKVTTITFESTTHENDEIISEIYEITVPFEEGKDPLTLIKENSNFDNSIISILDVDTYIAKFKMPLNVFLNFCEGKNIKRIEEFC